MIKPITITELKELKKMEHSELRGFVSILYKTNDKVKEIVNVKFVGEKYQEELLESYKEKMFAEFFPKNMRKIPSFKLAKAMITEFKSVGSFEIVIDLMLYFVECGNEFTNEFGDIDGPFYNRLCRVYGQLIDQLNFKGEGTEDLYMKFKERIESLISSSSGIGWGYGDFIYDKSSELNWIQDET